MIETQPELLIVGEGNGSFSLCLGVLRRSIEKIFTTWFSDLSYELGDVINICIDQVPNNNKIFQDDDLYPLKSNENILERYEDIKSQGCTWKREINVDCTNLQKYSRSVSSEYFQTIFFQCPYIGEGQTPQLILDFFASANNVQQQGGFIFIGITLTFPFIQYYSLHSLIEDETEIGQCDPWKHINYSFRGIDTRFMRYVLSYGYKHKGIRDCHKDIAEKMSVLVFEKIHAHDI